MHCYICDFSETTPNDYDVLDDGTVNRLVHLKEESRHICEKCLDICAETIVEYNIGDDDWMMDEQDS